MLLTTLLLVTALTTAKPDTVQNADSVRTPICTVAIAADSIITPGDTFSVAIQLADTSVEVGGCNLLIDYDYGALVFDSATLGSLTGGQWEYFEFRSAVRETADTSEPRAFIRLVAIADMYSTEGEPDSGSLAGPGEIARLYFYAGDRLAGEMRSVDLNFLWLACGDNSFADRSGNKLYLSNEVFDADGDTVASSASEYRGAPSDCFGSKINTPQPLFNFRNLRLRTGVPGKAQPGLLKPGGN